MPLGNGDIGINAWSEENGDILFYIGKTDSWLIGAEPQSRGWGGPAKLGKIRIRVTPNPFQKGILQKLRLGSGKIEFSNADEKNRFELVLWVDASNPVIRISAVGSRPSTIQVSYEMWRNSDEYLIPEMPENQILWFHKNNGSVFSSTLERQHLGTIWRAVPDPLAKRIFGCHLWGDGFTRSLPVVLRSKNPEKNQSLAIAVLAMPSATESSFVAGLKKISGKLMEQDPAVAEKAHLAWWRSFWERSWIRISPGKKSMDASEVQNIFRLEQAYALQRFLYACSGRGQYPIKFNGSIFTMDIEDKGKVISADSRRWGAPYWFQNTRLIYWPMLAAGDFEMMRPFFDMYTSLLPQLKERTKLYFGHAGAFFPETMYSWGAYRNEDYGEGGDCLPIGMIENSYIRWHWNGALELSAMMLAWRDYSGDDSSFSGTMFPALSSFLEFFEYHFPKQSYPDGKNKMLIAPSQALESWWGAVNPTPDIAGLSTVLDDLIVLPAPLLSSSERKRWIGLRGSLPMVPLAPVNSDWTLPYRTDAQPLPQILLDSPRIMPAAIPGQLVNSENPELYAVFPFPVFGVGRPGLDIGRASYFSRLNRSNSCWSQDEIQAAMLGLSQEAEAGLFKRLEGTCGQCRFPAFWGPGHDWVPDMDHGAVLMLALQRMLIQYTDGKLHILPAWPKDWDVDFKLHLQGKRTVRVVVRGGTLQTLEIIPPMKKDDVIIY